MHTTCPACKTSFDVDDERARDVRTARCVCGAMIDLHGSGARRQFGKYVLQERIAAGGMGEVFLAKVGGVEGFERQVAIKKMLPHLSDDRDFINMLVKEAKLTVLLHHPNIVQVYDLDKEGDEYYIAMEYVPSVNLSMLLEHCSATDTPIPVSVAVSVALQTLQGLSYAHTLTDADGQPMGILHRDITPQNILITKEGWIKLTDFGIAKAKNEISTTRPGTIRGKLGYVAPEQLKTKAADQRVDIFCAGVVLWESLACQRLFKGEDEIDTLRLIVETHVPSLCSRRDDVSGELDAVVRKALSGNPEARHPTAAAFYDDLVAAMQPDTAEDYLKETRRFLATLAPLFERKGQDAGAADTLTVALGTTADKRSSNSRCVTITDLVVRPRRARRTGLLIAVFVMLLAASGAFAWWRTTAPSSVPLTPLTVPEVQAAIDAAREQLLLCYGGQVTPGVVPKAKVAVLPNGHVADVEITPVSIAKVSPCLTGIIKDTQLRAHPAARFEATVQLPDPPEPVHDPATPPTPPRPTSAPPDDTHPTRSLSPDEIQRGVLSHFGAITRCLGQLDVGSAPETLNAHLVIQPNGRVASVDLTPALASASATKCLTTTLKSLHFRAGTKAVEANLPLHLQRRATAP